MPPFPVHREIMETAGAVEKRINEWEPRVAAGGDLLPIPSHLVLEKLIAHHSTEEQKASTTSEVYMYETRTTNTDGLLAEEQKAYYGHGGSHTAHTLHRFDWRIDKDYGQLTPREAFGYTTPLFDVYSGQTTNSDGGSVRLSQKEDGTIMFERDASTLTLLRQSPREDAPGTVWSIMKRVDSSYSHITEKLDEQGRLESATYAVNDGDGGGLHKENLIFSYDEAGRLINEVKVVRAAYSAQTDSYSDERTEATAYIYNEDGTIELQTTLEDGTVIRKSKRFYNQDGSFEHAETVEDLPGEDRTRTSVLRAKSYKYITKPLLLDMF